MTRVVTVDEIDDVESSEREADRDVPLVTLGDIERRVRVEAVPEPDDVEEADGTVEREDESVMQDLDFVSE